MDARPHDMPVVYVIDDNPDVRESLEVLVASAGWRAETFASACAFLERPRARAPSCLVLDLFLPDIGGLELQERVARDRKELPIVFVAEYGDVPTAVRAMKAGAMDFLTKPYHEKPLLDAIASAIAHSRATLDREDQNRSLRERYATLTPREREVLALVVSGLLNKQVGFELGISEITVKTHRGHAMRKMKARSLAALVEMALQLGHQAGIVAPTTPSSARERPSPQLRSYTPPSPKASPIPWCRSIRSQE
jgi:FixJ family two-component response regulator